MREIPLSLCERASVTAALAAGRRLDNRKLLQVRDISIHFGQDYGCCTAVVGQTRVLAQVTSEVVEPRPSRPNEGKLQINVHLSPMAAPHYEQGPRGNELVDQLQQLLDRNIKDSRCLDLESLCILAEESVWQLRCDVTVLNAAGNLSDACNLAAVSALRHFHRPDVTVEEDGRVTLHTFAEMEPIPTYMKKIPVCLTFAFFMEEDTYYTLLDPTDIEERVQSGRLIIGLNPHGEITSLIFPGRVSLQKEQIMNCIHIAFSKAKATAEMVQEVVEEDLEKRKKKRVIKTAGFTKGLISDANYVKNKYDKMSDQMHKIDLLVSSIRNTLAQDEKQSDVEVMEDSDEEIPLATGHYPPEEVRREKAKEVDSFLAAIRKGTEGNNAENINEKCKEDMEVLEDYSSEESNEEEDVTKATSAGKEVDSFLAAFRKDTVGNNAENVNEKGKEDMEVLEDYNSEESSEEQENVKKATSAGKEVDSFLAAFRKDTVGNKAENIRKDTVGNNAENVNEKGKEDMEVLEDYNSEESSEEQENVKKATSTGKEVNSFLDAFRKDTVGNKAENINEKCKEDMEVLEDYRSEESSEEQEDVKKATAAGKEVDSFHTTFKKDTVRNNTENTNEEHKEDKEVLGDYMSEESKEEQEGVKKVTPAGNINSLLSALRSTSPSKVKDHVDETMESDSEEEKITEKLTANDLG